MRVLVKLSQEELGKLGEIMGNEIEEAEDAAYAIHELIASAEQMGKGNNVLWIIITSVKPQSTMSPVGCKRRSI